EPRERGRAQGVARGGARAGAATHRERPAADCAVERALSLRELRLQHAALHLALPELQALGDDAADTELPARGDALVALVAAGVRRSPFCVELLRQTPRMPA